MRTHLILAGAVLAMGTAGARAACSDDIAALESQANGAGRAAVAANSSGQKDAAARASQAQEAQKTGQPVENLPKAGAGGGVAATKEAEQASDAGEGVMAAKVSLNEARNAQKKGDEKACLDAVNKAKAQMKK